jgi:starch synthase (maltosyl-transferring)
VDKRFPIYDIDPVVYFGDEFRGAKAVVNEQIPIRASVVREGHDALGVQVILSNPQGEEVQRYLMREIWPGLDRFEGYVKPTGIGNWNFHIEAFDDPFHTWEHDCGIKIRAGT